MLVEVEERAIQQQCLLDLVVKVVEEMVVHKMKIIFQPDLEPQIEVAVVVVLIEVLALLVLVVVVVKVL